MRANAPLPKPASFCRSFLRAILVAADFVKRKERTFVHRREHVGYRASVAGEMDYNSNIKVALKAQQVREDLADIRIVSRISCGER